MARFLFIVVLLACLFYTFQTNPLPQDVEQSALSDLDRLTNEAKEAWDKSLSDLWKALLNQGNEVIVKETEKFWKEAS